MYLVLIYNFTYVFEIQTIYLKNTDFSFFFFKHIKNLSMASSEFNILKFYFNQKSQRELKLSSRTPHNLEPGQVTKRTPERAPKSNQWRHRALVQDFRLHRFNEHVCPSVLRTHKCRQTHTQTTKIS